MAVNIKERLVAFFDEVTEKNVGKSKLDFSKIFDRLYKEYEELFSAISEEVESASDRTLKIDEIASYIPDYVGDTILKNVSKRKADVLMVDFNMQLVVFILPMLNQTNLDGCKEVGARLVELWNQRFSVNIGNTEYNQINTGFQQRLCFITTAVCNSLNKPDDCYELTTLRAYRDQYLIEECQEDALVEEYYQIAPVIVKNIDSQSDCAIIYKNILADYIEPCVKLIEEGKNEECKELYIQMVRTLKEKYTA